MVAQVADRHHGWADCGGIGPEGAVEAYVEARTRPTQLQQVQDYCWRIVLGMRSGRSFAEVSAEVMRDIAGFQEPMLAPPNSRPTTPRRARPPPRRHHARLELQEDTLPAPTVAQGARARATSAREGQGQGEGTTVGGRPWKNWDSADRFQGRSRTQGGGWQSKR